MPDNTDRQREFERTIAESKDAQAEAVSVLDDVIGRLERLSLALRQQGGTFPMEQVDADRFRRRGDRNGGSRV